MQVSALAQTPAAGGPPPAPVAPAAAGAQPNSLADSWRGALRVMRSSRGAGAAEAKASRAIFPNADKVWMHVYGTDQRKVENARRGVQPWICSKGCSLQEPTPATPGAASQLPAARTIADRMLRSIKISTPRHPLPLLIWRPSSPGSPNTSGTLLFDPKLLGRRSYRHVCAYPPVRQGGKPKAAPSCPQRGRPMTPRPADAEMTLGFHWPRTSELADFQYLAIVDQCGNARVQSFQRIFTVPVMHVATGGCGSPDGRILRVFPSGGFFRITAFNLDTPAAGDVVNATFRVSIPALEDVVSADAPKMLYPDPRMDQLSIDCGPRVHRARLGAGGLPRRAPPGQTAPPGRRKPSLSATQPSRPSATAASKAGAPPPPSKRPRTGPPPRRPAPKRPPVRKAGGYYMPAVGSSGQPMAHQGLVLAPEPLRNGNCRIEMRGQTKRRLVAPLALEIRITRTDKSQLPTLLRKTWVVTPTDSVFRIPPLANSFDGESRLLVEVYSQPASPEGNMILLSDAARWSRKNRDSNGAASSEQLKQLIGSVTVHTAPLCGDSNFETVAQAGSCFRGYFTVPAMLATLQLTRAPWVERPLITRTVLSAVGVAFAMDSYNPVERNAFPVALHVGGFVQDLGQSRIGLTSYLGVAPIVPILGEGGNTTSVGLLGGIGMTYVTQNNGPDEGFKPTAFLSVIVQVGQANPSLQGTTQTGGTAFGSFNPAQTMSGVTK